MRLPRRHNPGASGGEREKEDRSKGDPFLAEGKDASFGLQDTRIGEAAFGRDDLEIVSGTVTPQRSEDDHGRNKILSPGEGCRANP